MAAHPRLYFDAAELDSLRTRASGGPGHHALIWDNLALDADRFARRDPTPEWIAPAAEDPRYENLYDRFWAIMSDAAIVEHLAFTSAYGGCERTADAAVRRLLAATARWRQEADLPPDYGTAYATTRILKAIAIGYDLLYERLSPHDLASVCHVMRTGAARLARDWFSRPDVSGPVGIEAGLHSPHHSSVEWSAFGIVALSLLPDVEEAAGWVATAVRQFADHLLPGALRTDGSHAEGTAFWASTVLSQLQFLDALRRGTGEDLLTPAAAAVDVRLALATFRPYREQTADGEPIYGDSTGMSAVLLKLARERRDPQLQRVALTERCTGRMETWPARTPLRGEQMRISVGGYAYAWYEPELSPSAAVAVRHAWHFPLAREAYVRTGWDRDDTLVAVREGKVSVYAGGDVVFEDLTPRRVVDVEQSVAAGTGIYRLDPPDLAADIIDVVDSSVRCGAATRDVVATVSLGQGGEVIIDRRDGHRRTWSGDAGITVQCGQVERTTPDGHRPDLRAGYGLLDVVETNPRSYPTMTVAPEDGRITVQVQPPDGAGPAMR